MTIEEAIRHLEQSDVLYLADGDTKSQRAVDMAIECLKVVRAMRISLDVILDRSEEKKNDI